MPGLRKVLSGFMRPEYRAACEYVSDDKNSYLTLVFSKFASGQAASDRTRELLSSERGCASETVCKGRLGGTPGQLATGSGGSWLAVGADSGGTGYLAGAVQSGSILCEIPAELPQRVLILNTDAGALLSQQIESVHGLLRRTCGQ